MAKTKAQLEEAIEEKTEEMITHMETIVRLCEYYSKRKMVVMLKVLTKMEDDLWEDCALDVGEIPDDVVICKNRFFEMGLLKE